MKLVRRSLVLGLLLSAIGLAVVVVGAPHGAVMDGRQGLLAPPGAATPGAAAWNGSPAQAAPLGPGPAPASPGPQRVLVGPGAAAGRGSSIVATRIRISRLGIDLPIVDGDGVDAPLGMAAHYPGTGWPGGGTNIYLYAHARDGMFLALWEARPGDEIDLDLADGSTRPYAVSRVLPRVPWDAIQYTKATRDEQLTLQTCTGDTATAPRFIVIALPEAQG